MKIIRIIVVFLFFASVVFAQDKTLLDKITLKTGETYTGEILVQNSEVVMLKSANGSRFQFQLSEVKKIEKISKEAALNADSAMYHSPGNNSFAGFLEIAGGVSAAKRSFDSSPNTQVSLVFGSKSIVGRFIFMGIGAGLNSTFTDGNNSTINFVPVFIKMQAKLSENISAPYFAIDAGYAFAVTEGFGGGPFTRISAGIARKISYKSILSFGFFVGVNSFDASLTELKNGNSYSFYGNTIMTNYGLKIGLTF